MTTITRETIPTDWQKGMTRARARHIKATLCRDGSYRVRSGSRPSVYRLALGPARWGRAPARHPADTAPACLRSPWRRCRGLPVLPFHRDDVRRHFGYEHHHDQQLDSQHGRYCAVLGVFPAGGAISSIAHHKGLAGHNLPSL